MQFPDTAGTNGRPASRSRPVGAARSELDRLRATCRSQALTIDALGQAVCALRRGAAALKAENADLRTERDRLRSGRRGARAPAVVSTPARPLAVRLPCDVRAPGAARIVVAQGLGDRVAAGVLQSAQLLVSELVSNSVRHSGAGAEDAVIVRVGLSRTLVRLEVEDPGRGGVIAPRPPDLDSGGGFGLQLVQALSERWGLERVADGGTLVWAQLPRAPVTAPATSGEPADAGRARPALTPTNQRARGRRATPAGGQP
jgi:anti-sigma regulatory factor (Ser/Thr protein kinase)